MKALRLIPVLLCLGLLVPGSAHATVVESADYVGGGLGEITTQCLHLTDTLSVNLGGACFAVQSGMNRLSINIADKVNSDVGMQLRFYAADGTTGVGNFVSACTSVSVFVPQGAATVRVYNDNVLNGMNRCHLTAPGGFGTLGTITATWSFIGE